MRESVSECMSESVARRMQLRLLVLLDMPVARTCMQLGFLRLVRVSDSMCPAGADTIWCMHQLVSTGCSTLTVWLASVCLNAQVCSCCTPLEPVLQWNGVLFKAWVCKNQMGNGGSCRLPGDATGASAVAPCTCKQAIEGVIYRDF